MPKSNLLRSPRIFLKKQQAEFEARQREIEALNQQILNNFQPTKGNEEELAPVLENYVPQDNTTVPPVLNTGNLGGIDSLKITHPEIYEKYKNDPAKLVELANAFLVPARDENQTTLEGLSKKRDSDLFKRIFTDPTNREVGEQRDMDTINFGEEYALDQRAKSLTAIRQEAKKPFTTLFDDGNVVPPVYKRPVLYDGPEEAIPEQDMPMPTQARLDPYMEIPEQYMPMPTGARLDPYMEIPKQDMPMPTGARLDPYMEIPKSDAPAGYHRMDDGTLMSDSDMPPEGGLSEAVLSDGTTKVGANTPILMGDNTDQAPSRSFSAPSANARGSSMPYDKIGRNEMLMRAGGRIMANSDLGLNKALGAGMDEYGQIQDANRANEIAKFNQDETTRLAEARMAAAKAKADAKNNKPVSPESLRYGQAALASINSIQSSLDNDTSKNIFDSMNIFDNATGIFGNLLKSVPNTPAHSVMLNIETIEAAVAFDRLQAMRNASKTGGALGQVSNIELRLLSSSLGNLKQSNNKEEFQRNLDQVKKVYNEIVHGKDYQDPSDVINPTTNNDALYNEADAIIG